jgi:hypothetical protein
MSPALSTLSVPCLPASVKNNKKLYGVKNRVGYTNPKSETDSKASNSNDRNRMNQRF